MHLASCRTKFFDSFHEGEKRFGGLFDNHRRVMRWDVSALTSSPQIGNRCFHVGLLRGTDGCTHELLCNCRSDQNERD